ncbi:MAG: ABC transporter permease, partial [Conexibacter sp.]
GSHEPATEAVSPWFLFARQYGIVVFWILICAGFTLASPVFLTGSNVTGIFEHSAVIAIFAAGEAIVIIAASLDLSIAPVAAVAGILAAKLLKADAPPVVALLGGLGVGVGVGWLNGFITIKMRISPLIATLGTFSAFTGVGLILTKGYPLTGATGLEYLGLEKVAGVASCVWIMLAVFALLGAVMAGTVWGVRLMAVGGNAEAARRAGVNADRYLWGAFIVCGLCAALAGLVTLGTLTTAEPVVADGVIFDAITAVALAGVLLSGGRGSLPKVLLGALILSTIQNGLTLLDVPSYYQLVTTGVLLILAVWVEGSLSRAIEHRRTMVPASTPDTTTA